MAAMREALPFTAIQGFLHGYSQTLPNQEQILDMMVAVAAAQIRFVAAAAQNSGTGATVIDVRLNGTSIWHNPNDRPTLPANATGRFVSGRVNRSAVQPGDVLSLVVAQAGGGSQIAATVALEDPSQRHG